MRELILMRHAEAAPPTSHGTDFLRPLTSVGSKAAAAAGLQLSKRHGAPDCLLCSSATRAVETATALHAALSPGAAQPCGDARIYRANAAMLLQIIAAAPDSARRLLLIGHNPAISELATGLQGAGSRAQTMRPAEYRHFELAINHWRELRVPK